MLNVGAPLTDGELLLEGLLLVEGACDSVGLVLIEGLEENVTVGGEVTPLGMKYALSKYAASR